MWWGQMGGLAAQATRVDELIQGRCNRCEKGTKGKLLGNSMRKGTSEVNSERLARDRSKNQKKTPEMVEKAKGV